MKENRKVYLLLLILSLCTGGAISLYYWTHDTLKDVRYIPLYMAILAFVYVLLQMLKRYLFSKGNWWDWLYYIGLLAVALPTFFMTDANAGMFHLFAEIGTLFLIFPVLLDGKQWLDGKV